MSYSEESTSYARERVKWFLENQCRIPVRPTTPIAFYYNKADSLIDEAEYQYKMGQLEQSFILYSRYVTYVERDAHPDPMRVLV